MFQCDLTKDDLLDNIPADSVDVVTLIFVLSAVHPDKMHLVLRNIYKVKPADFTAFKAFSFFLAQMSISFLRKFLSCNGDFSHYIPWMYFISLLNMQD